MARTGNITFDYTVSYLEYKTNGPYFAYFQPGAYLFELWGAQGGCLDGCANAKGGYSRGVLYLRHSAKIFINVGQKGSCVSVPNTKTEKSYNGGGIGRTANATKFKSCAGGGATDVRIKNNSVYHRILVSGGGGGDTFYDKYEYGGYGGGLVGGNASERCEESGFGGNQEAGGKGIHTGSKGSFGEGGSVLIWDGGGGGGGWYGGSAGQGCQNPGGGGSGFALTSSSYKYAKKINEYAISKEYFLTNTKVVNGNEQQYAFQTIDPIKGNSGDGKAKITILHSMSQKTCQFKHQNHFNVCVLLIVIQK